MTAKNGESLPCLGKSNTVTVVSIKVIKNSCVTVIKQLCNSKSCKTVNSALQQLGMGCVQGREGEAGQTEVARASLGRRGEGPERSWLLGATH